MVHAALDIAMLRRACAGQRLGATVHYLDTTDSTNTVARQHAATGAAEGTVVIADAQAKGRGRLGRTWVSPPLRNLYMSVVLHPPIEPAAAPQIGLVAGVAVAAAVAEWAPAAVLKWPNDVLLAGRKVAGILMEMEANVDRIRFVILGIGVNLNTGPEEFPEDLRDKAVSLMTVCGAPVDRGTFAARLLAHLEDCYARFVRDGFAAIRPLWEARSCLHGAEVRIDTGGGRVDGIVAGMADDGCLVVRTAPGEDVRVVAGDVSVVGGYAAGRPGT